MNRREVFFISITVFLTVLAWVIYDLLQIINYKEFSNFNFEKVLQTKSLFPTKVIEVLKQKDIDVIQ